MSDLAAQKRANRKAPGRQPCEFVIAGSDRGQRAMERTNGDGRTNDDDFPLQAADRSRRLLRHRAGAGRPRQRLARGALGTACCRRCCCFACCRGSWSSRSPHPIGVLRSAPPRRSAWPATAMPGRSPNLRRICSPVPIIAVGLITLGTLRLIVQRPFAVSSRAGSGQARSLSNQVAKVTSSG